MSTNINPPKDEGFAEFTGLGQASDSRHRWTSVLVDGVIYSDTRRLLCSAKHCAGATASVTGLSLEGHPVVPITDDDVAWWNATPGLGPLTCECKRLRVGTDGQIEEGTS